MSDFVQIIVYLLVFAFLVFCLLVWRFPKEVGANLKNIKSFRASKGGVTIEFYRQLEKAVNEKGGSTDLGAAPITSLWAGREILWVDDNPANNFHEAAMFEALGANIVFAKSNSAAIDIISKLSPALIISDIAREGIDESGLELPDVIRSAKLALPPIVYYVGDAEEGTTPHGFPVTDLPDALYKAVARALAGGKASANVQPLQHDERAGRHPRAFPRDA